jgi:hypothetical protein
MIAVIIFYIHVIFLVYIFTRNLLDEGKASAILSVIFIVVIFAVGWTLAEFIMSLFMAPEGVSLLFPRFAFSLILLTGMEGMLYTFYYSRKRFSRRAAENTEI